MTSLAVCSAEKSAFVDVPHLLKLLRNHILDHDLRLRDSITINRAVFNKLLEANDAEFRLCRFLRQKDIWVSFIMYLHCDNPFCFCFLCSHLAQTFKGSDFN